MRSLWVLIGENGNSFAMETIGLFLFGLAVLLFSANYFVDGIADLAERAGVPPLVVGMTVVAFGTSTPEMVVNALSAYRGETALAFGNIVGSCIVNIGFVLGVTALVKPLKVEPSLITREIPMLLVAVAAMVILASDHHLNVAGPDSFGRADGLILLLLFAIFLYYTTIYSAIKKRLAGDAFMREVAAEDPSRTKGSLAKPLLLTLGGLIGVSLGANWTVDGATGLARTIGLSEQVIGLTIVSMGTTLPELITCILAARRGSADIALGNIVGSNLFNILAIGGTVAAIRPIPVPDGGYTDLLFMAFLACVLLPIAIRSGQVVTRGEGAFLLVSYAGFLAWRLSGA